MVKSQPKSWFTEEEPVFQLKYKDREDQCASSVRQGTGILSYSLGPQSFCSVQVFN